MPLTPLNIQAGIFKESSELGAADRNRWSDGNLVRFWKGQPEPIGGWIEETLSGGPVLGIPRGLLDWTDLIGFQNVAIGTHLKLYVLRGGQLADITPVRESGTLGADPFTTTLGSTEVTVSDSLHGLAVNAYVTFSGATTVGGITIDGEYAVTEVVDTNTYKIVDDETATSSATGGGAAVDYVYLINPGSSTATFGRGWGAGAWSEGTWGTPRETTETFLFPRSWYLDTWGEDLIANPRGQGIYQWDTSTGLTSNRATQISGSPDTAQAILVHPEARHLIAFGAHTGSVSDPLFIRWCSQNDLTDWTPTETNTAGDRRLEDGSTILGALLSSLGNILVFTDTALYNMEYTGPPYVFSIHHISTNCGIIAPRAATFYQDRAYYMGNENFFVFDGSLSILPCDVLSYIYDDLDRDNANKTHAGIIESTREIIFFYPSNEDGTGEASRYVTYNVVDKNWSIGNLARTSWRDRSETFKLPFATDSNGILYTHERDDIFPDGAFVESGELNMGQGDNFLFADRVIPDFERNTGTVYLTLYAKRYPGATEEFTKGPYSLTSTTDKVDFRLRGRQVKVRLNSDDVDWRLSGIRIRAKRDGSR